LPPPREPRLRPRRSKHRDLCRGELKEAAEKRNAEDRNAESGKQAANHGKRAARKAGKEMRMNKAVIGFCAFWFSAMKKFRLRERLEMLLLKYLLRLTGWGLLIASAVTACKNFYQVVQYHRQLRRMAPGSLSGTSSGPEGASSRPPSTHGASMEKPRLNWTTAPMGVSRGLAAAHSRCRHSGGARRDGRHQSETDRGDAPRHFASGGACLAAYPW
jgi:hypothetical protein